VEVQHGEQHKGSAASQVVSLLGRGALVVTMSAASLRWQERRPSSLLMCENALYRSRMQPMPAKRSTVQRAWRASEQLPSRQCIGCAGHLQPRIHSAVLGCRGFVDTAATCGRC